MSSEEMIRQTLCQYIPNPMKSLDECGHGATHEVQSKTGDQAHWMPVCVLHAASYASDRHYRVRPVPHHP